MASIELEHVTKFYEAAQPAVRDLSLTVEDGELLVLVGPSGCGKSTVLRLVAGLEMPTTGRIIIGGEDMTAVPPQHRDVAMVFQSYALYPHMTVRQNLGFGLRMRGVPAGDVANSVEKTAEMLGIRALLDRRPAQLSGGQRQRVALGRALARHARAYLLDEPLSNLDPLLRVDTRSELALLHRQLASTMVYVTHDQEEAMTLGSRIAVMRDGLVEQVGPPLDVYRHPANRFVASFIGTPRVNLFACACTRLGGAWSLASSLLIRPVVLPGFDGQLPQEIEAGFRPQDTELCAAEDAHIVGTAVLIEPLGPATLLHLRVNGASEDSLRVVVPADTLIRHGDQVGFRIRLDRLHLFDIASERRLGELPRPGAGPAKMAPEHR